MKGNLWKVICFLIAVTMLMAACSPAAATEAPAPAATKAPAPAATEAPAPAATEAPAATGCVDADRVPIAWSTIAGFYTDAMNEIVAGFEATHCVKVTIVGIDNSQLYDKQIIEAVGDTGAYDVYTMETAEKAGFAESGYILPMDDYIAANAADVADSGRHYDPLQGSYLGFAVLYLHPGPVLPPGPV
jgi:maltose-binding protein MalE